MIENRLRDIGKVIYMIILHNDYIFLPQIKKEDTHILSNDADDTIRIQMRKRVPFYLTSVFGEPIHKDTENGMLKIVYTYVLEIKKIVYEVIFAMHNITQYTYLEVCVSGKTVHQVVGALEYIQEKIVGSDIERNYVMIISYDSVSEYYCNKAYPKLNQLERNIRKLLFNTYTVNFGVDYYQKTVSAELQEKIKGVIQAKGNEEKKQIERLKKFFYSMEFSDIQDLLFTKKWTTVEEESKAEFLSKHEKLTEMSEESLRSAFDTFSPKSDWERLFADKISNGEIENMIETVRSIRNDIAHCKFFYKDQYNTFNKTVTDLNQLILEAIRLTEEQDFADKQMESIRVALKGMADTVTQFKESIQDSINSSLQSVSLVISELRDTIGKMLSNIDFNKLSLNENELNGEDDEGTSI